MNPIQTLFHLPWALSHLSWVARLGWTLLNFLWQGLLIAALLAVLRQFPGKRSGAPGRYAAACAALAAMVMAPLVTFLVLNSGGASPVAVAAVAQNGLLAVGVPPASPASSIWDLASPWLGAAWVAGVMFCLLRLSGGWLFTARLRTIHTRPAADEWQSTLARLAARLGVAEPVRLLVSSRVEVPVVMGWLRPVILVPVGALAGLPAAHLEALLAHELAHIRRHDYLVNLCQSLAEALLFYHPAVWWVSGVIRAEREYCCDDLAVAAAGGDALNYARALADLESCRPSHAPTPIMAATGGSLRNRIRRLVEPSAIQSHNLPSRAAAWALASILMISAGALAVRAAESPAPQAQEPVVKRDAIWPDTVKFGDMTITVRGRGTLTSASAVVVMLAPTHTAKVAAGQPVVIDLPKRGVTIKGSVQGMRPGLTKGLVTADLSVEGPFPSGVNFGDQIDVAITIGKLINVVYVGRPVFAQKNSAVTLFKLDPDGQHAFRVRVEFGRTSVNSIEVKSGLQPGDHVILSDMKAYDGFDRITVK